MIVTHKIPIRKNLIPIREMVAGQIGIDDKGNYFYRTMTSAACLNNPKESYSSCASQVDVLVEILPVGTVLTITLDK